jgi:hypothetical protein
MLNQQKVKELFSKQNKKLSEQQSKEVVQLLKQLAEIAYSEYNKSNTYGRCNNIYESINRGTS